MDSAEDIGHQIVVVCGEIDTNRQIKELRAQCITPALNSTRVHFIRHVYELECLIDICVVF